MAAIASIGSNAPNGALGTGLPTPVLLALVGGGIGAVVLLRRKMNSGGSGTPTDQQTLLPNTAIMLGSLQQGVLDLKGQVGQGQVDLSSQLTGTQENISAEIDALTSQMQQGFQTVQSNIGDIGKANTNTILDAFKTQGSALSTLIGASADANKAYAQGLQDSLSKGMTDIAAQHNAELAGIGALQRTQAGQGNILQWLQGQTVATQTQILGVNSNLLAGLQQVYSGQQAIRGDITGNPVYYQQAAGWATQSAKTQAMIPPNPANPADTSLPVSAWV